MLDQATNRSAGPGPCSPLKSPARRKRVSCPADGGVASLPHQFVHGDTSWICSVESVRASDSTPVISSHLFACLPRIFTAIFLVLRRPSPERVCQARASSVCCLGQRVGVSVHTRQPARQAPPRSWEMHFVLHDSATVQHSGVTRPRRGGFVGGTKTRQRQG